MDDTPIACWSERRLVIFDPSAPSLMVTENLDMEFMLQGSFSRFCNCQLQYRFGQDRTCVRVDVPSMLLASSGDLREEGSTAQTTRLQVSDSDRRRLSVEHRPNLPSSSTLITYHDPSGLVQKATIELRINPEDDEAEIVKRPSVRELEEVIKVEHANARALSQIGILGTATNQSKAFSRQLALMVPKLQQVRDGKQLNWKAMEANQKEYGGRLKPLLIARKPLSVDDEMRRAAIQKLVEQLPVLDTRKADCPPFHGRGRMHAESGSRDMCLRHLGANKLEFVALTVPEGLPFLACAEERGLAFDPVGPQVTVLENVKMQWELTGRRFVFGISFGGQEEQSTLIDLGGFAAGRESVVDLGSTADVIRLQATSFSGARTEITYFPRLAEPKCSIRMIQDFDESDLELEITIGAANAAPLVKVPDRDVVAKVVPVWEWNKVGELPEMMRILGSTLIANLGAVDAGARKMYSQFDDRPHDWDEVRANQLRVGRQLKDLLATTTPAPTPDDTPISPQFASEDGATVH